MKLAAVFEALGLFLEGRIDHAEACRALFDGPGRPDGRGALDAELLGAGGWSETLEDLRSAGVLLGGPGSP